jgi:hypothetical protein
VRPIRCPADSRRKRRAAAWITDSNCQVSLVD